MVGLQYVFMCGTKMKHEIVFSSEIAVKRFDAHIKVFSPSQLLSKSDHQKIFISTSSLKANVNQRSVVFVSLCLWR